MQERGGGATEPRAPSFALAFVATLGSDPEEAARAAAALAAEASLGGAAARLEPLPFDPFTAYYEAEMGRGLLRSIVLFDAPFDAPSLPGLKRRAIAVERAVSAADGRRRVNLDPGYLTLRKVVLATTKDAAHRVAIADGIFAELALAFRDGGYRAWPWTYPDYASAPVTAFFDAARPRVPR